MYKPDPVDRWLYRLTMLIVAVTIPFLVWAMLILLINIFQ